MNTLLFGKDLEERKEMIIALLVIIFFCWLTYQMGWFSVEKETPTVVMENSAVKQHSDTDLDGIYNTSDACPFLAGVAENKGCPSDVDGDGVVDSADECINESGLKVNNGCPLHQQSIHHRVVEKPVAIELESTPIDTDGDGFYDSADKCPGIAGSENGCPIDADKDGVYDSNDLCPTIAGIPENNGCPTDSDRDGVVDMIDKCPEVAGVRANKGCPADSDRDGIADVNDKCPNKTGTPESEGCPMVNVTEAERKVISEAIGSVRFITDSSRLMDVSKILLDRVAQLLVNKPEYKLKIYGHTDSMGNDVHNLMLSRDRALSTYNYLISKGIHENRISHDGFGETRPVASNQTREGRLKNRRVEFKLHY